MQIDYTLKQILKCQDVFSWHIKESDKIVKKLKILESKKFDAEKYNKLSDKLLELQLRYKHNKTQYSKYIKQLKNIFKKNYGIDILGILEDSIDTAK